MNLHHFENDEDSWWFHSEVCEPALTFFILLRKMEIVSVKQLFLHPLIDVCVLPTSSSSREDTYNFKKLNQD